MATGSNGSCHASRMRTAPESIVALGRRSLAGHRQTLGGGGARPLFIRIADARSCLASLTERIAFNQPDEVAPAGALF